MHSIGKTDRAVSPGNSGRQLVNRQAVRPARQIARGRVISPACFATRGQSNSPDSNFHILHSNSLSSRPCALTASLSPGQPIGLLSIRVARGNIAGTDNLAPRTATVSRRSCMYTLREAGLSTCIVRRHCGQFGATYWLGQSCAYRVRIARSSRNVVWSKMRC
jgi:hypothetical protein